MNPFLYFQKNFLNKRFVIFLCFTLLWGKAYCQDLKSDLPENNGMSSLRLSNIDSVFSGYINNKKVGTSNFGGLIATAGDLIFATGTEDKKIIALNSNNGQEVWAYDMIAAGSTAPITFEIDNKQYLAVIASGGRYHNYTKSNGELYIFSLK